VTHRDWSGTVVVVSLTPSRSFTLAKLKHGPADLPQSISTEPSHQAIDYRYQSSLKVADDPCIDITALARGHLRIPFHSSTFWKSHSVYPDFSTRRHAAAFTVFLTFPSWEDPESDPCAHHPVIFCPMVLSQENGKREEGRKEGQEGEAKRDRERQRGKEKK
jgi:hypothetical protein